MITLSTAVAFAGLAVAMALSPGPNLLYLASRSLFQGRAAGFASLCGVCTAMLVYMCATALGLSALMIAVPYAYTALRFAGACYLLFLAYRIFRQPRSFPSTSWLRPETNSALFGRGFLTCIFNPKIVLMYGALLPQFVAPNRGSVLVQTLELGTVQIAAAAFTHGCIIMSAVQVSHLLQRIPGFARVQRYILGSALVVVAAKIGLERKTA